MPAKKAPTVKEVPVSFVQQFQLVEKVCPVCGKSFMGTKKAKYDSNACQQKANYARHGEKYRAQKVEKYHATKTASHSGGKK